MICKNDFYKEISEKTGFAFRNIQEVMKAHYELLVEHMKDEEDVRAMEGVTFVPTLVEEKTRYVPLIREDRVIPEHIAVKVKISQKFKDRVNEKE